MPIKDTQGDLSAKGSGAFEGLPASGFTIEVVNDTAPNGGNARNAGAISTNRASEDH